METIAITTTIRNLAKSNSNFIICKDLKLVTVPIEGTRVQRQVELTNPIEYTRKDVLEKYGNHKVIKWVNTFTEDGKEAIAIVLEGEIE